MEWRGRMPMAKMQHHSGLGPARWDPAAIMLTAMLTLHAFDTVGSACPTGSVLRKAPKARRTQPCPATGRFFSVAVQILIPSPALGRGHLLERLPSIKLGFEHFHQLLPRGPDRALVAHQTHGTVAGETSGAWMLRPRYGPCPAAEQSRASYGSLAWRCAAPIALNQARGARRCSSRPLPTKELPRRRQHQFLYIHGIGSKDAAHVQPR